MRDMTLTAEDIGSALNETLLAANAHMRLYYCHDPEPHYELRFLSRQKFSCYRAYKDPSEACRAFNRAIEICKSGRDINARL